MTESARPEILYRNGVAVPRRVREAPPIMAYDARLDAWVAPGHWLAELRAWAAERGIHEAIDGRALVLAGRARIEQRHRVWSRDRPRIAPVMAAVERFARVPAR